MSTRGESWAAAVVLTELETMQPSRTWSPQALRMIHVARACGLQILLGCMVSSSVSTTAAAQLSPLVDFADLDGHLLVSDDPWEGVRVQNGRLVLSDRPGLGLVPRKG